MLKSFLLRLITLSGMVKLVIGERYCPIVEIKIDITVDINISRIGCLTINFTNLNCRFFIHVTIFEEAKSKDCI